MSSDQEVRNSILVMLNREFYRWVKRLSEDKNFATCVALSDRAVEEQYDMELVLRFIIFRSLSQMSLAKIGDLGEFLTDEAKSRAQEKDFDYAAEEEVFRDTFALLAETLGDDAFRRYDTQRKRFVGGFSVSAYYYWVIKLDGSPPVAEGFAEARSMLERYDSRACR